MFTVTIIVCVIVSLWFIAAGLVFGNAVSYILFNTCLLQTKMDKIPSLKLCADIWHSLNTKTKKMMKIPIIGILLALVIGGVMGLFAGSKLTVYLTTILIVLLCGGWIWVLLVKDVDAKTTKHVNAVYNK